MRASMLLLAAALCTSSCSEPDTKSVAAEASSPDDDAFGFRDSSERVEGATIDAQHDVLKADVASVPSDASSNADSFSIDGAACDGAAPSGFVYLDNGVVRLGIDLDRGAAIGYFSLSGGTHNVLDTFDTGRFWQQSYYGDNRGGSWNGKPWPFNPVQGGDWTGVPSRVTAFCATSSSLYARTIPRDWVVQA